MKRHLGLMILVLVTMITTTAKAESKKSSQNETRIEDLQALALSGNSKAQFQLGVLYEEGRGGIKRDLAYALSWYEEAARNGLKIATYRLKMLNQP